MNDTLSISTWIECPTTGSARPGFYQFALHLNNWKTQSERKASPLHLLPVSPLSHNSLWRLNTPAQMHILHTDLHVRLAITQRQSPHTRFTEIPHMRAVSWPSCLAGQRWMSCLLGTHILHACVLPDSMFPSSVIGFFHLVQRQRAFGLSALVRYFTFAFSIFLYLILRRMCARCRSLSSSGSGRLRLLALTLKRW